MGLGDLFKPQPTIPTINGILPDVAKKEIRNGRLPILKTDKVFLKAGENCHYIEKAIYEQEKVQKRYVRKSAGYSMPGLFKGTRIHLGGGQMDAVEKTQYDTQRGILYITNKRIIFVGEKGGLNLKTTDLIAITPYNNCIELQFAKKMYRLFVPDGAIANAVLQLIQ